MRTDLVIVAIDRSEVFPTLIAIIVVGATLFWLARVVVSKVRGIRYAGVAKRDIARTDPPLTLALTLKAYASDLRLPPGLRQPSTARTAWHLELIDRRVSHITASPIVWQSVDSEIIRKLVLSNSELHQYWPSQKNGSPLLDAAFDQHLKVIIDCAETIAARFRSPAKPEYLS